LPVAAGCVPIVVWELELAVNLFECIRQGILNHPVAPANAPICATGRATTSEHAQPAHGLTGQQVAAVLSSMDAQGSESLSTLSVYHSTSKDSLPLAVLKTMMDNASD
jgi:hypothetical protein